MHMRISMHFRGYVYDKNTGNVVVDPAILSSLVGWRYEGDSLYNYLGTKLVDLGVVGGTIRVTWEPERGLDIIIDYWAPDTLQQSDIDQLREDTDSQLADGIGEG